MEAQNNRKGDTTVWPDDPPWRTQRQKSELGAIQEDAELELQEDNERNSQTPQAAVSENEDIPEGEQAMEIANVSSYIPLHENLDYNQVYDQDYHGDGECSHGYINDLSECSEGYYDDLDDSTSDCQDPGRTDGGLSGSSRSSARAAKFRFGQEFIEDRSLVKEKKYTVLPSISGTKNPKTKTPKSGNQLDYTRDRIEQEADFFADYRLNTSCIQMTPRQKPLPPIKQGIFSEDLKQ